MTSVAQAPLRREALPVAVPVAGAVAVAHRRRAWLLFALPALAVAVALVIVLARRLAAPDAAAFRTTPAVRADITERVTATGTVQPVITSPVGAQVSGIVWKLHADFNSRVKAGDLLVELDPALFQNAVALATAQLSQAEANLTAAQATAVGARLARDRTRSLTLDALASLTDRDATQAIFAQTEGLARSSVAQIAQAHAQLRLARLNLEHSIIRSPVEGTVISRNIDVGQAVAATLTAPTLFTIAQDMRLMQVHAAVDEADIGGVRAGQHATFTVDAFRDRSFDALVREVRNAAQTLSNVVTYDVVLDVDNPEEALRPGMTANVVVVVRQRTQVVAVANEALRFRPAGGTGATTGSPPPSSRGTTGSAVYVPQGTTALRLPVRTGATDGNLTEVEGIEPGRAVIIDVARPGSRSAAPGGAPGRGN